MSAPVSESVAVPDGRSITPLAPRETIRTSRRLLPGFTYCTVIARFHPSTDPLVAAKAKTEAGVAGWLLAETYFRARPLPGFVLGFAGHPIPQLVASAKRLAEASLTVLRANRRANSGTGVRRPKSTTSP